MYTANIDNLIGKLKKSDIKDFYKKGEEITRVKVDDFVSKIANIYEKIRNAIEYREDHLLRKSAIFRILQRLLVINVSNDNIALALVKELIRAGYIENNFIPSKKVDEVQAIIERYLALFNFSKSKKNTKEGNKMFKWLVEMAAVEIEECLFPPVTNRALVEFMFKVMKGKVNIMDKNMSEKEKDLHIYLTICRALIKSDDSMIDLMLLKYYYPDWRTADKLRVMELAKKLNNLKVTIDKKRNLYSLGKLYLSFKKYTFIFLVLRDIILENPKEAENIFASPELLEYHIRQTCEASYKNSRTKLRRSIFRVTIYVFLTKMLLALILEVPYDRYIAHQVDVMPLIINAVFPPILIFILGMFIRVPSKKNTNSVVKLAHEIVYKNNLNGIKSGLGVSVKKARIFNIIFNILYIALFIFSFGVLVYILRSLHFNSFSIFIFLLFLSVVSFFGIKMRHKIRELIVVEKKENPLVFLINLFTLPFLRVGHWMSEKFAKINVFVFILDFIIEAPFKIFLEVIEDWIAFLREKKEEIYNQ